jgi:hypothetical protein
MAPDQDRKGRLIPSGDELFQQLLVRDTSQRISAERPPKVAKKRGAVGSGHQTFSTGFPLLPA